MPESALSFFLLLKKKGKKKGFRQGNCGLRRTLELLFEALMLIMSQREHQKASDLTDASAGPVLVSEVQMIHLLGGKVRD